eukprot:252369_1
MSSTLAGVMFGNFELDRISATAPATKGAAMDVPEPVLRPLVLTDADLISSPGAQMSIALPRFDHFSQRSRSSKFPTVIHFSELAGDTVLASTPSFPAATTTTTPRSTNASVAVLTIREYGE